MICVFPKIGRTAASPRTFFSSTAERPILYLVVQFGILHDFHHVGKVASDCLPATEQYMALGDKRAPLRDTDGHVCRDVRALPYALCILCKQAI